MFRADHIDRDLLEEQARLVLGRVHRNDVVIMEKLP
jgi:cell division protein FtsB